MEGVAGVPVEMTGPGGDGGVAAVWGEATRAEWLVAIISKASGFRGASGFSEASGFAELVEDGGEVEEVPAWSLPFFMCMKEEPEKWTVLWVGGKPRASEVCGCRWRALMSSTRRAAGDVVGVDKLFVDGDVDAGEGAVELAVGFLELVVGEHGGRGWEAEGAAGGVAELVDGWFAVVVPDLGEPEAGEAVGVGHGALLAEGEKCSRGGWRDVQGRNGAPSSRAAT